MDLGLHKKTAFVSASSLGLGKASAMQLAVEGANVMICGRNEEKLIKASEEINGLAKGNCKYVVCDITKTKDTKHAIKYTRETFGQIDILINNSGGPPGGGFEDFDDEDWMNAFELNLLSYVRLIREVLPDLKENNGGRIINLASSSIKQPIPGLLLSNVFRLGVQGLTKTLAEELSPYNILVNTIAPGRISTDRVGILDQKKAEKMGLSVEEVEKQSKLTIPLRRYGEVEEFAAMVAFIASKKSSYITGSTIIIDGGMVKAL